MDEETFGSVARKARTAAGLTLVHVGSRIGIDHARLSRIESGLARPTAAEVHGLVRELGLDPERALALAAAFPRRGHGSAPEEAA
jgi:transcriptional regulator with XRE-family HTH domain